MPRRYRDIHIVQTKMNHKLNIEQLLNQSASSAINRFEIKSIKLDFLRVI